MQRVIADSHFFQRLTAVDNGIASRASRTYSTNSLRESSGDRFSSTSFLHSFDPFNNFFDVWAMFAPRVVASCWRHRSLWKIRLDVVAFPRLSTPASRLSPAFSIAEQAFVELRVVFWRLHRRFSTWLPWDFTVFERKNQGFFHYFPKLSFGGARCGTLCAKHRYLPVWHGKKHRPWETFQVRKHRFPIGTIMGYPRPAHGKMWLCVRKGEIPDVQQKGGQTANMSLQKPIIIRVAREYVPRWN